MGLAIHQHRLVVLLQDFVLAADEYRIQKAIGDIFVLFHLFNHLHIIFIKPLLTQFDSLHGVHRCKIQNIPRNQVLHFIEGDSRADSPHIKEIAVVFIVIHLVVVVGVLASQSVLDLVEPSENIRFYCFYLEEQR